MYLKSVFLSLLYFKSVVVIFSLLLYFLFKSVVFPFKTSVVVFPFKKSVVFPFKKSVVVFPFKVCCCISFKKSLLLYFKSVVVILSLLLLF